MEIKLCSPALFILILGIIVIAIEMFRIRRYNETRKEKIVNTLESVVLLVMKVAIVQLLCKFNLEWLAWTLIIIQILVILYYIVLEMRMRD